MRKLCIGFFQRSEHAPSIMRYFPPTRVWDCCNQSVYVQFLEELTGPSAHTSFMLWLGLLSIECVLGGVLFFVEEVTWQKMVLL
jgi:hypothetical protein